MKTLLIIPCYNEENRLPIDELVQFIEKENAGLTFLFVNDGSTDNTINILNDIADKHSLVRVLDLQQNCAEPWPSDEPQ